MKKENADCCRREPDPALVGMSVSLCQRSCSGTCPWSRSCAACSSSSTTMWLVAMLLGFPALKSFTRECRACANKSRLNESKCAFPGDISKNRRGKLWRPPLLTYRDSLYHSPKAAGLNRCVQTGGRHWTKLSCPGGGIRAMNYAEM